VKKSFGGILTRNCLREKSPGGSFKAVKKLCGESYKKLC